MEKKIKRCGRGQKGSQNQLPAAPRVTEALQYIADAPKAKQHLQDGHQFSGGESRDGDLPRSQASLPLWGSESDA